jgi:undecaprenyl-diphosphatase
VVAVGAIAVTALVVARRRELAIALVVSSAGAWLLVNATKLAVQRPRPPETARLVSAGGWSFPSGHAGQGAAMYMAIGVLAWISVRSVWLRRTLAGAFGVVGIAIGLSRVYLGVHWLSDVVAGWLLGLAWFLAVLAVVTTWLDRSRRQEAMRRARHERS